jgi:KaiC/GvpD/RAD55 family RecA-like ATPase
MERVATGIPGFDEMIAGGLPKNSLTLLTGTCGTGKTTFCAEFLYNGATKFGEKGVYISFEESPELVKTDMSLFGMNFDALEAERKVVFVKYDPYHIEDIFDIIESNVRLTGATRVCIDSISALGLYVRDIPELRRMIFNLGITLRKLNCTSVITSEIPPGAAGISRFGVEEFISDSVVVLYYFKSESTFTRAITVWKMRATDHSKKIHPYQIGENGIVTFPQEEAVMR